MRDSDQIIFFFLAASFVGVVAGYFLTRWYHKIDTRIAMQREQIRLLKVIAGELPAKNGPQTTADIAGKYDTTDVNNPEKLQELLDNIKKE